MNKELTKVKKSMRDKEKEISKLRSEISAFKKVDSNIVKEKSAETNTKEQQD